jgi:hypothetical protein
MTELGHALYIVNALRRRAELERNAQGVETQWARCLSDAADLIVSAYLRPDITDVPVTGGRL